MGPIGLTGVEQVPLGEVDDDAIVALAATTFVLGRPPAGPIVGFESYVRACLAWYLGEGRADGVGFLGAEGLVGYGLVCLDPEAHRRTTIRALLAHARRLGPLLSGGAAAAAGRRFHRLRLSDALVLGRRSTGRLPHTHLAVAPGHRRGSIARAVRDHADDRCRRAGAPAWTGEVNALAGRRARALVRTLGVLVATEPNHTLSWLAGEPVERLVVVRDPAAVARQRGAGRYSSTGEMQICSSP